jgi:hypothetical protein
MAEVVLRVTALPSVKIGPMTRMPAVARMMDRDVPEIPEEQPRCGTNRVQETERPPERGEADATQQREAQPRWSAVRRERIIVVVSVQPLERWKVVQDVTV